MCTIMSYVMLLFEKHVTDKILRLQGDDMSAPYDEKILFRLHLALWANSLYTIFIPNNIF